MLLFPVQSVWESGKNSSNTSLISFRWPNFTSSDEKNILM